MPRRWCVVATPILASSQRPASTRIIATVPTTVSPSSAKKIMPPGAMIARLGVVEHLEVRRLDLEQALDPLEVEPPEFGRVLAAGTASTANAAHATAPPRHSRASSPRNDGVLDRAAHVPALTQQPLAPESHAVEDPERARVVRVDVGLEPAELQRRGTHGR